MEEAVPTKRIFDMVVITSLSLHLAWRGLVRPWGQHLLAGHHGSGWQQTLGEVAVRAA